MKGVLIIFFLTWTTISTPLYLYGEEHPDIKIQENEKISSVSSREIERRILSGESVHFVQDQDNSKRTIPASLVIKAIENKVSIVDISNAFFEGAFDLTKIPPITISEAPISEELKKQIHESNVENII